jgi:hypothetical protein
MIYKIKRAGKVIAEVEPEGRRSLKIMDVNTVEMTFTLPHAVDFAIGDYVGVFGDRYTIKPPDLPNVDKLSSIKFSYSLLFKSRAYDLQDAVYMTLDANNEYTEADFTQMGNADTFIDLLLINANRYQKGWTKGTIDDTPFKNMAFSNENCLSVLSTLATQYNLEWWVDGQTIHMTKKGIVEDFTLQYGKGNGLFSLSRKSQTEKNIVTRLYAYGSYRNLPADYKGYSKRLKIPVLLGNTAKYGDKEKSVTFDDIMPEHLGTVTEVSGIYTFTDTSMDFDVNAQRLPGVKAKVQFNTGQLAGYAFEIAKYDHSKATFTILNNQDEKALVLPSDYFHPQPGDQYVLIDLNMPQSKIDKAHERLKVKALEYLDENSEPMVVYGATSDKHNLRKRAIRLKLGNYVKIIDKDFNLNANIRITALSQNINDEFDYSVDLQQVVSISQAVRSYENYQQLQSAVKLNRLTDITRSRMSWLQAEELRSRIYDPDGYFDMGNIKPLSIQTSMLESGVKSQQFALQGVVMEANFEGNASRFYSSNGNLVHFTISNTPVTWVLPSVLITGLEPATAYWIYIKCSKTDNTAKLVLSFPVIGTDEVDGYYHFLAGMLNSVIDGVRGISLTYGLTTINGRFIKTGLIEGNGCYFDLDKGEIGGKIHLLPGSTGLPSLPTLPDFSTYALNAYVNAVKDDLQGQIDGQIMSWFKDYEPTLSNEPASTWLSDADRNKHVGDLFYWNSKGYAYRFSKDAGTGAFTWVIVRDTDIVLALANAQKAQDTADGKRRTFNKQPYTPYDEGDLWTNGSDLYRCDVTRASGPFIAADWSPAVDHDNTQTIIDGGIITSGTIILGNATMQNCGVTGEGTSPESIRFWGGASFADRAIAHFRVNDAGKAFMTDAVISGTITAQSGQIGNYTIDQYGLINTENKDAYIIQRRTYPSGYSVEASMGTNISVDGWVGQFRNTEPRGIPNNCVSITAANGTWSAPLLPDLTGNMALSVSGDISQSGGNVVVQGKMVLLGGLKVGGRDGLSGNFDLMTGGSGYVNYTFAQGILVKIGQ